MATIRPTHYPANVGTDEATNAALFTIEAVNVPIIKRQSDT